MSKLGREKRKQAEQKSVERENYLNYHLSRSVGFRSERTEKPLSSFFEAFIDKSVRPIETFSKKGRSDNQEKHLLDLARHLFVQYRVPKIMDQVWHSSYKNNTHKLWYICLATGGSLYKSYLKEDFTKKELNFFLTCKRDITIDQAKVYAIARAYTNNEGTAFKLSMTRLKERPFNLFWKNVIRFFSLDENASASIKEINDLCDFIEAKRLETQDSQTPFSVFGSGYTLASLTKKMIDWHYALRRAKNMGNHEWKGRAQDDQVITTSNPRNSHPDSWVFKQILTSKDLAAEGTAMHHCVVYYRKRCIDGDVSIWSVQFADAYNVPRRKLTIEVSRYGEIRQIRGFANRKATPQEMSVVNRWARQNDLNLYNCY